MTDRTGKPYSATARRRDRNWQTVLGPADPTPLVIVDPETGDEREGSRTRPVIGYIKPAHERAIAKRAANDQTPPPANDDYDTARAMILDANRTLKRLPIPRDVQGLRSVKSQLGKFDKTTRPGMKPTGRAIDDLERVLDWLLLLKGPDYELVAMLVCGFSFRETGDALGLSHEGVRKRLDRIVADLVSAPRRIS